MFGPPRAYSSRRIQKPKKRSGRSGQCLCISRFHVQLSLWLGRDKPRDAREGVRGKSEVPNTSGLPKLLQEDSRRREALFARCTIGGFLFLFLAGIPDFLLRSTRPVVIQIWP
jgi:hypothetical protein